MRGSTNVGSKYDSAADMEARKAPGGGTALVTLEKYSDGRPSLVRAGVGTISIFSMKCSVGDAINEGDTLLIMESMKMESEIKAHQAGTVQSILVKEGDSVKTGDSLVIIG